MTWQLKPSVAAVLDRPTVEQVERAVNSLAQSKLPTEPWKSVLAIEHDLCELKPDVKDESWEP
jgi:hypothetical protein